MISLARLQISFIAIASLLLAVPAAYSATPYYEGKTVRIIVGTAPGGGYDTYTRLLARHFSKHIPGTPNVIVDNMPGAGGLLSANHMYRVAKADGLTIGHFVGGQFLQQLLGRPGIEFDARRFEYIGVPAQDNFVLTVAKASGVTSMEQWMSSKTLIKFGAIAPGDGTYDVPKVIEATLGVPIQIVSGYKGTAPIRLAFNSGEVAGLSNSWQSLKSTWTKELESGEAVLLAQLTTKAHADLPKLPLAMSLAKNDEARKLIVAVAQSHGAAVRPYLLPPETPKNLVEILRKSFMEAIRDPELLAEAKKARLEINPGSGEELERNVTELLRLDAPLVTRLKDILK
jgi:tripartite-type tricarboxylate transporter receptor subunit TctC